VQIGLPSAVGGCGDAMCENCDLSDQSER